MSPEVICVLNKWAKTQEYFNISAEQHLNFPLGHPEGGVCAAFRACWKLHLSLIHGVDLDFSLRGHVLNIFCGQSQSVLSILLCVLLPIFWATSTTSLKISSR